MRLDQALAIAKDILHNLIDYPQEAKAKHFKEDQAFLADTLLSLPKEGKCQLTHQQKIK